MGFALSKMQLTSPAFAAGGRIPPKHSRQAPNVSPALARCDDPEGTRSFAVVCHDPDAPLVTGGHYGYVHWVLYNIPGTVRNLAEGTTDYTSGVTDFGKPGYGGPMPPPGHGTHHYYYWVFALNAELNLEPGLTLWQLLEKIEPHPLGMNRLVGTYSRG